MLLYRKQAISVRNKTRLKEQEQLFGLKTRVNSRTQGRTKSAKVLFPGLALHKFVVYHGSVS